MVRWIFVGVGTIVLAVITYGAPQLQQGTQQYPSRTTGEFVEVSDSSAYIILVDARSCRALEEIIIETGFLRTAPHILSTNESVSRSPTTGL